jgi:hypothetical protein
METNEFEPTHLLTLSSSTGIISYQIRIEQDENNEDVWYDKNAWDGGESFDYYMKKDQLWCNGSRVFGIHWTLFKNFIQPIYRKNKL